MTRFLPSLGFIVFALSSCSKPQPDIHPPGTIVSLEFRMDGGNKSFLLGPKATAAFLKIVGTAPKRGGVEGMTAAPKAIINVNETRYYWHGAIITKGRRFDEVMWSAAWLTSLSDAIKDVDIIRDEQGIKSVISEMESR